MRKINHSVSLTDIKEETSELDEASAAFESNPQVFGCDFKSKLILFVILTNYAIIVYLNILCNIVYCVLKRI